MGQLGSKMRFMAAQMVAYLETGVWERNARHSNEMAALLRDRVKDVEGLEVVYPVEVNSVFVRLPRRVWRSLLEDYFFYDWDEEDNVVRWMCSFDTTEGDVEGFVERLRCVSLC